MDEKTILQGGHRAVLVRDNNCKIVGKVTQHDINGSHGRGSFVYLATDEDANSSRYVEFHLQPSQHGRDSWQREDINQNILLASAGTWMKSYCRQK